MLHWEPQRARDESIRPALSSAVGDLENALGAMQLIGVDAQLATVAGALAGEHVCRLSDGSAGPGLRMSDVLPVEVVLR